MSPYRTPGERPPATGTTYAAGDVVRVVAPRPGHLCHLGKRYVVARVLDDAIVVSDGIFAPDEIVKVQADESINPT